MKTIGAVDSSKSVYSSWMQEHLVAILLVAAIILIGCYKLWMGGNFLVKEDTWATSNYTYGNALGNGWRPDKGLGTSLFYSDPGGQHPWALLTFWEKLFSSRITSYNTSVLLLWLIGGVAQYFFLRMILTASGHFSANVHKWVAILLAPLIMFGSDFAGYTLLRNTITNTVGIPLILLLLYAYYQKPQRWHFYFIVLLYCFVPLLGNFWAQFQIMYLGLAFTILYLIYFKAPVKDIFKKFLAINIVGTLGLLVLAAWILYPMHLEKSLVDHVREKAFHFPQVIQWVPDMRGLINYLIGVTTVLLIPNQEQLVGLDPLTFPYTFNVSIIFPLVYLAFIFNRSTSFWEFALKWLLGIFFVYWFFMITNLFSFGTLFKYLSHLSSKLITMYDFPFPLQVGLLGIFLCRLKTDPLKIKNFLGRGIQLVLAFFLLGLMAGLGLFSLGSFLFPESMFQLGSQLIETLVPESVNGFSGELLSYIARYNLKELIRLYEGPALVFSITAVLLLIPFLRNQWLIRIKNYSTLLIAALLIINGISLTWTTSALYEKDALWKEYPLKGFGFQPTDRFYYVKEKPQVRSLEEFKRIWGDFERGKTRQYQLGLSDTPGLNFSGLKSFEMKQVQDFIQYIFNGDGSQRLSLLRLYYGGPMYASDLMDMCAINYYYSDYEMRDLPPNFQLFHAEPQLYIYKNLDAWPYYFLARKLVKSESMPFKGIEREAAYVQPEDYFEQGIPEGVSSVQLKNFSFGRLRFEFEGNREELLVVADAWHPHWKAQGAGKNLEVIQVNGVLKGVKLPAGKYQVELFFDTAPYTAGIWVSLAGLVVLIVSLPWVFKKRGGQDASKLGPSYVQRNQTMSYLQK